MNAITIELSAEDRKRLDRLADAFEAYFGKATREEPVAEKEPTVTLAQIQQKVVLLCADTNGEKKAKARAIVTAYSPTVSGLSDFPDKWDEIWDKLTALEKEE